MADVSKTTRELKLNAGFYDNDTRMLTWDNPAQNLSASAIKTFETWCVTNQPIIGDKNSTRFVRFLSAKILEKTVTQLDLSDV